MTEQTKIWKRFTGKENRGTLIATIILIVTAIAAIITALVYAVGGDGEGEPEAPATATAPQTVQVAPRPSASGTAAPDLSSASAVPTSEPSQSSATSSAKPVDKASSGLPENFPLPEGLEPTSTEEVPGATRVNFKPANTSDVVTFYQAALIEDGASEYYVSGSKISPSGDAARINVEGPGLKEGSKLTIRKNGTMFLDMEK